MTLHAATGGLADLPADSWSPACMSVTEHAEWREANERTYGASRAARPCADCTAPYATRMLKEGRCNGQPGQVAAVASPVTPAATGASPAKLPLATVLEETARDAAGYIRLALRGKVKLSEVENRALLTAAVGALAAYTRDRTTTARLRQVRVVEAQLMADPVSGPDITRLLARPGDE